MRLTISHETRYRFATPVTYGLQQLRMTPKNTRGQRVLNWSTRIEGGRKQVAYDDFHRNAVELVSFDPGMQNFAVHSGGAVEIIDNHGIVGPHQGSAPLWLFMRQTERTRPGPGCRAIISRVEGEEPLERLHDLSRKISHAVTYEVGGSEQHWTAEESIEAGRGVCQDHAHVFLACARAMGFPARYVSGFLMLNDRIEQDATHAWAEAHVDALGWVGFDVSNAISPDARYVRVATGLDYAQAAPVSGIRLGGDGESLSVTVAVAQQ